MSETPNSPDFSYDVAIVGYGPTGASLANLLGKAGLKVVVLERDAVIHPLPRAVHFDGEVMRIFQAMGLAGPIGAVARASAKGTHFVNAAGRTMLIRRAFEGAGPQGWAVNWYVHQPDLDRELRRGVARYANVDVRLQRDVLDVETAAGHVVVRAQDTVRGAAETYSARFAVGCDGGRSLMRRIVGSSMEDLGLRQPWFVVDVLIDPASERARLLPDYTIQHCDPARPITAVYVGGNRRRWEIMVMPGDDTRRMGEPERFWPMLSRWVGPQDGVLERSALYTFHSVVANGWRRGRVLLAGDSCHQTPPFLGQGMCAGIRDAMNLAWKLDRVVNGGASEAILDTYESERRPHVHAFIKLAVEIGGVIQATDPVVAAERDRRFAAGEPEMFEFPQPQLGPGIRDEGAPPVGVVQPQPRLADGRLLDDATGCRFRVLASRAVLDAARDATGEVLQRIGAAVVQADDEPEVAKLLADLDAAALVLRPDGYAFGIARTGTDLARLVARLAELGLVPPSKR